MTGPAAQPALREPVECSISVDERELVSLYPWLRQVQIQMSRRSATTATLVFDSLRDETGQWVVQDSGLLRPWKKIRIEACFGHHREEVMRGYILEIKADCPQDMAAASVTVVVQDESLLLDREHRRGRLSDEDAPLSDGQLASKIATDHDLVPQVEQGLTSAGLNVDKTLVQLLRERAEANGFEFRVRAGTLFFGAPQLGGQPQPTIIVYGGPQTNCLRFATRFDGHSPDAVRLVREARPGDEPDEQELAPDLPLLGRQRADSADAGLRPFVWTLARPTGPGDAEAVSRAQARANENAWKLVAEGELDGALYEHVLLTHETVNVDGVGDTYGGLYYVDEVQHVFSADGYRQAFKLLRNATGATPVDVVDPVAALRT